MTLSDALNRLDLDRAAFLAAYDALAPEQRDFRPDSGGWTADEVVQHVVRVETGVLHIVAAQAVAGDDRRAVGEPNEAALAAVEAFMRSDGRTLMPAAAEARIAPTDPPGPEWRERLGEFAEAWREAEAQMPAGLDGVALVEHPRAGGLTATGAVRFLASHLDHHTRQFARLRAAPGFPEA